MSRKNKGLRTCLYSNKHFERQEMIRFVKIDKNLIIDANQTLPGRGYWLKPTDQAMNDAKLIQILSKRTKCSVKPELIEEIRRYGKN